MTELTNADRAERVRTALAVIEWDCVEDILADIMHYCAEDGLEFYEAVRMAEMHYEAECDA